MVPSAFVRQFAVSQQIDLDVADQEVVLHYALALLNEVGLLGLQPDRREPGPLLFKGGTALRKCIFGSTGRFSQDIDLDATHENGFEAAVEATFQPARPFCQRPSVSPQGRPSNLPICGHDFSPPVAIGSPRLSPSVAAA